MMAFFGRWPREGPRLWLRLFMFLLVVAVMMPWTYRLEYALRANWSCDGEISLRYRTEHGGLPALHVRGKEHTAELDGVDKSLWEQAKEGQRLAKSKGSAFGTLDGNRVRIVPRMMPWFFEPGAP
jgi:hypothetical protein